MGEILMPSVGPDMASGVLLKWRIKVGDTVARMDPVAYMETIKGIMDIESYVDGVVDELLVTPGDRVPVGEPIARLRDT